MMKATLFGLVAIAVLSSCAVGPDYHRPDVQMPDRYRFMAENSSVSVLDLPWWKAFGDPVLNSLVDEALKNNWSLKAALANSEKATAAIIQARSPLFPQISLSGEGGRERLSELNAEPITHLRNPQNAYTASMGASWEIDLWGKVRRMTEAAVADAKSVEQTRRAALLSVVANVATYYINLLSLDDQLQIAKNTAATYKESLRIIELQYQYGVTSQMTVSQAASQYETAESQIPRIQQSMTQTENALAILLGRNPGQIPRGMKLAQLKCPPIPADLPSNLLLRRPDILSAEQDLMSANAMIGATRALYFPSISLTGAFGNASEAFNNLWKGPARAWSFAGVISMPIFQGGSIYSQVKQAEASQRAALAQYQMVVQSAFLDVDTAFALRSRIHTQLEKETRLVDQLRHYSRLSKLQYDEGYSAYTTVLQADQTLFPSELTLAGLRASKLTAVVGLYKVLGGGWVDLADQKAGRSLAKQAD